MEPIKVQCPDVELLRSLVQDVKLAQAQAQAAQTVLNVHVTTVLKCKGIEGQIKDVNVETGEITIIPPSKEQPT